MHKISSTEIFQEYFLGTFHSRKLLLHNPHFLTPLPAAAPRPPPSTADVFDSNIVLILSVILCGVICSFGLNFLLRCALRCTNSFVSSGSSSRGNSEALPANLGIDEKALKAFPVVNYSVEMKQKLPAVDTECAICLSNFVSGETLRLLPKCNHGFHVGCIDEWLKSHSSCPKCRQSLIEPSLKVLESGGVSSPESSPAAPESNFCIVPLRPEGLTCNFGRV